MLFSMPMLARSIRHLRQCLQSKPSLHHCTVYYAVGSQGIWRHIEVMVGSSVVPTHKAGISNSRMLLVMMLFQEFHRFTSVFATSHCLVMSRGMDGEKSTMKFWSLPPFTVIAFMMSKTKTVSIACLNVYIVLCTKCVRHHCRYSREGDFCFLFCSYRYRYPK